MRKLSIIGVACLAIAAGLVGEAAEDDALRFHNVSMPAATTWLPETQPDARIRYGSESPVQFADLRLPAGPAPEAGFPVVVFVHGGAWRAEYGTDYTAAFVERLTRAGLATWDLEFRRLGNAGGGYPGTFRDVAAGTDHLRELAKSQPLDLRRVVAVGHSSGGHLALWLAARGRLPVDSELASPDPLPLAAVVSLAGVNDLEQALTLGRRNDVLTLLGVDQLDQAAARLDAADPARLFPFGLPQVLLIGSQDNDWRIAMTADYAERARAAGDRVIHQLLDGANHFDIIDPHSGVAERVAGLVIELAPEAE